MTQEQKRIKIAEACGWEFKAVEVLLGDIADSIEWETGWVSPTGDYVGNINHLPDYFNDLNAMREVEMWMFESFDTLEGAERLSLYTKHLVALKHPLFATAAQRAEAFGKTLNLW